MSKTELKLTNWPDYNRALTQRGSLTFWLDEEALSTWTCSAHHGGRGRAQYFSNLAIETCLTLKVIFKMPLRMTQGFTQSLLDLMGTGLQAPSYTCLSKRSREVDVQYRPPSRGQPVHLLVDATGIKVSGEGEWFRKKHRKGKKRVFRKLHLAVDAESGDMISAEVTMASVGDNEALGDLINPLRRPIHKITADGAYDTKNCYTLIDKKGATPCIPPRSNAALWKKGHPRNEAVTYLHNDDLKAWKIASGYHQRSKAETAMFRFKTLAFERFSSRRYNGQVTEAMIAVKAINKMNTLGLPKY